MQLDALDYNLEVSYHSALKCEKFVNMVEIRDNWKEYGYSYFGLSKRSYSTSTNHLCTEIMTLINSFIRYILNLSSTLEKYRIKIIKAMKRGMDDSWEYIREFDRSTIIFHLKQKIIRKCKRLTRKPSFERFIFRLQKFITYIHMTYSFHGSIPIINQFIKNIEWFMKKYTDYWVPKLYVILDTRNLMYIDQRTNNHYLMDKRIKRLIHRTLIMRFKRISPREVNFIITPKKHNKLMMELFRYYLKNSNGYHIHPIPMKYKYLYLDYYDTICPV